MSKFTSPHKRFKGKEVPDDLNEEIFENASNVLSHMFFNSPEEDYYNREAENEKEEMLQNLFKDKGIDDFPGSSPNSKAEIMAQVVRDSPNEKTARKKLEEIEELEKELSDGSEEGDSFVRKLAGKDKNLETVVEQLMQIIDNFNVFKTEYIEEKIYTNKGDKREMKQMKSYSELPKITMGQVAHPLFDLNLAKKELLVKKKYEIKKTLKERNIILLLDDSGSMSWNKKETAVQIVLRKFVKMLKEGSLTKVDLHLFETSINNSYYFTKSEELRNYLKSRRSPVGGNTEVSACIEEVLKKVYKNEDLSKTHLLVLNDGQDYIDVKDLGVKVSAITLEQHNEDLKKLTELNNGQYELVNTSDYRESDYYDDSSYDDDDEDW